ERTWTARTKGLRQTARGLPKRGTGQVAAVAREVRRVVDVERLTDDRQAKVVSNRYGSTQSDIERVEVIVERIDGVQRQPRNRRPMRILGAGVRSIELGHETLQICAPQAAIECVHGRSRQQVVGRAVTIEVDAADVCAEWWRARVREVEPEVDLPRQPQ